MIREIPEIINRLSTYTLGRVYGDRISICRSQFIVRDFNVLMIREFEPC